MLELLEKESKQQLLHFPASTKTPFKLLGAEKHADNKWRRRVFSVGPSIIPLHFASHRFVLTTE